MKKKHNDMEVFSLWMDYLRRNEDYRRLCEHVKSQGVLKLAPVPEEFRGKEGLVVNYLIFGDVYNKSNDELRFASELWTDIFKRPPELAFVSMVEEIDRYTEDYRRVHGRDPSLAELRTGLVDIPYQYLRLDSNQIYVESAMKALLSTLHEFVKVQEDHPFPEPSTRIRLDELKRYLRVYDLSVQNKTRREIAVEVYGSTDSNNQLYIHRDIEKARRIIKNVEACHFPGSYAD